MEDVQTRIESKENLFTVEVYSMAKMLFSKCVELVNIYQMARLVSLDSKKKTARNH